ncbi:uncharacterized protein PHACADRAFT_210641, partial [Phanerochaete carnosa HHB-10118-sp]
MPQLERLFIQNAMVPLDIPLDGTRPPQRRIDLPNLQWLKLEELDNEKFTPYAYLLAHMSYPSDTYISLKSSDYRQSWLADYTFVVSHAAPCRSTVMTGQQEFSSAKLLIEPNVRPNNLRLRFSATRMAASNKDTPEEAIVLDFTVPASALQVAELPASSDSWFGTMREADILDSVITLQVSAKELSALVSALEDSTQNGAAASLLPRWQFLRLTRCKSREFGTRASEKPARERLLAALAIRRKQDLGPSSVFLGVKKEEANFLGAYTLLLTPFYVPNLVDMLEEIAKTKTQTALASLRRLKIEPVAPRTTIYGHLRDERILVLQLLIALYELREYGFYLEMINLGTERVAVDGAINFGISLPSED